MVLREHEWRFGYAPEFELLTTTYATLFPPQHAYHAFFATEQSIEQLTLDDARWFFAQHYRPDNTRLVLVGDFVPETAKSLVERHFGALGAATSASGARAPSAVTAAAACHLAQQPYEPSAPRIVQRTLSRNQRLQLYWPVLPDEDPDALRGTFNLLRGELSEAARQTGLSHQVDGELMRLELGSFWVVTIEVAPGQPFEKVEPLFNAVVKDTRLTFAGERDLTAQRQAIELSERVAEAQLLSRAQNLARRECTRAACVEASKVLTRSSVNALDRFLSNRALVVERRYDPSASRDGSLELLP